MSSHAFQWEDFSIDFNRRVRFFGNFSKTADPILMIFGEMIELNETYNLSIISMDNSTVITKRESDPELIWRSRLVRITAAPPI